MAKKRKTRAYPESFRKEAVRLASLPDRTAVDVAKELGLNVVQIYNWKTLSEKQFRTRFILQSALLLNIIIL